MPVMCSLTSNDDSVVELPSVTLLLFSKVVLLSSSVKLFSFISREVTLSGKVVVITEEEEEEEDDSPSVVTDVESESDSEVKVVPLSASSRRGSTEVTLSTFTVGAGVVSELLRSVVLGLELVVSVERLVELLET